ncbi:DUF6097 family protein [Lysinibacillus sp. NPDC056232]|uniref:DUF6097 family protein n=1 Tax=Lysinibacillus sp. NPDC056232 TaxID=3345756 RepID=UPI0035E09FF3
MTNHNLQIEKILHLWYYILNILSKKEVRNLNYGKTMLEIYSSAEELKQLHKIISDYNLPIRSEDTFEKQAVEVSEYLKEPTFIEARNKKRSLNIMSGVIALPIVVFIVYMILGKLKIIGREDIFKNILDWFLAYPWAFILYAFIFASIVIAHKLIEKKMYNKIYPNLKLKLLDQLNQNIEK